MRVAAVVLAAGAGRRIGGPKALLRKGPLSFLAHVSGTLRRPSVEIVIAVLGHEAERVAREASAPSWVEIVTCARHAEGMLASFLCGLDAAEAAGAEAVLVHPVDHPLVAAETVDRVVAALTAGAIIAVPSVDGRRGHPGGFARAAWPALRAVSPDRGARGVLADHPDWITHVPGDPGAVAGIDTPADYARLVGS